MASARVSPRLLRFVGFLLALTFVPLARMGGQTAAPRALGDREFTEKLSSAAIEQTRHMVRYSSAYVRIPYPGGDVPSNTGVCTDVLIRAYRAVGIDLQREVHEDMASNLSRYPRIGNSSHPHTDTNIDHRRVPNLMTFFRRKGAAVPVTGSAADYRPGDVIAWDLGHGVLHVGLVVSERDPASHRWMIVNNIGLGPKLEDVLFEWKIIGHYRYFGEVN